MTAPINWTAEQLAWLESNKTLPRRELFEQLKAKFMDLDPRANQENMHGLLLRKGWLCGRNGRIQKGEKPWNKGVTGYMGANKTSFKKGQTPWKTRPVGSERICSKDGYILIKTAEPSVWRHKHNVLWERHHGEIPKHHIVRFLDGNKLNVVIENLQLVSRAANAVLNLHNKPNTDNPQLNKAIMLTEELKQKVKGNA